MSSTTYFVRFGSPLIPSVENSDAALYIKDVKAMAFQKASLHMVRNDGSVVILNNVRYFDDCRA